MPNLYAEKGGGDDEPFIATFLLVLPEPLPIAHGSTWTRQTEDREPLLDGVEVRPLEHLRRIEPVDEDAEGYNFVSVRFWQVPDDQEDVPVFLHRTRLAGRVAHSLNPEAVRDPEGIAEAWPNDHKPYQTVVEATTFVAGSADLEGTATRADPLTRCIEVVTDFHRAYRVATRSHVPELTYERLHPAVLWFRRPVDAEGAAPEPAGLLMLENRNFAMPEMTPLGDGVLWQIAQYNARGAAGDPFAAYAERRLEAEIEVWTNGRPREGVVQCGIAAEVLLGALLGMAMWEEHLSGALTVEEAADVLSLDVTPRIKSQYEKRFGGKWRFTENPIRRWHTDIAEPRNRAVHAGVKPGDDQATAALEALLALERYVGDRLAASWKTYPRTAWLFLGSAGFRKRGKKKLQAVEAWIASQGSNNFAAWVRDYQGWRREVDALVSRRRRA
ncbi:hypothetical protein [Blastococcus sp. TF02A-30]|uniref:hypothetical protein n=1 Tax=Blastococcus sp. TF02A-30 TaxID=2250580 RepID=UPI000DE96244|nr:hypothetical protein [Blastococcus sp. TF02A-30]RBY92673.1 hypothetical protein DQ241_00925 [Blastococcus sp. TF02A-30]